MEGEKATPLYCKGERQEYALRIMLAKANPEKYGSITIDGSDQACYGLPYFSQKTHGR